MRKQRDSEKAFIKYRRDYLGKFFKRDLAPLLKKHHGEIQKFREEWYLGNGVVKTQKDYDDWLKEIEQKLASKKRPVSFFEQEENLILRGYEVVGRDYFALMEDQPRVVPQGDRLEAVFDCEIRNFMRQIKIDPDWWNTFRHFILSGKLLISTVSHPNIEITERLIYGPGGEELDHRISLVCGPNTRIEEVQKVWKYIIEPWQKDKGISWKWDKREKPTLELALKALKLRNEGKNTQEIIKILGLNPDTYSEDTVRKMIARAKKHAR